MKKLVLLYVIIVAVTVPFLGCCDDCDDCPSAPQSEKQIRIDAADLEVAEGGTPVSYALALNAEPADTVTVSLELGMTSNGLAVAPATVVFTRDHWSEPAAVTVSAVDDAAVEGLHADRIDHVVVSGDPDYDAITVPGIDVTITDNDSPGLAISVTTLNLIEGGLPGVYELSLMTRPTATVTVTPVADPPIYNVSVEPVEVTIEPENWNEPITVTVTALEDGLQETNPQILEITHQVASDDPGYDGLTSDPVAVNVSDLDTPFLVLTAEPVTEGDDENLVVSLTLSNSSESTIEAHLRTVDGTAEAGQDYTPFDSIVSIAAGSLSSAVEIPVLDDLLPEGRESLDVEIVAVSGALAAFQSLTCYIDDDDQPGLAVADATAPEHAGLLIFEVSLSATSTVDVSFGARTIDASAVSGEDFALIDSTFSIPAGQLTTVVAVELVDDSISETNEYLTLEIVDVSGASLVDGVALGTIEDDDGFILSADDITVGEGEGPATLTVRLSQASDLTVSVAIATFDGEAVADQDYSGVQTTIVFPPGTTQRTVDIPIIDDALVEYDESFTIVLDDPDNADVLDGEVTCTVISDDTAVLSLDDVSGAEFNTTMTIVLELDRVTPWDVSVQVATVAGTATPGEDYVSMATTAVLTAGSLSTPVEVTILNDSQSEGDEFFDLVVGDLDGATTQDPIARCTIQDNDFPQISIDDVTVIEGVSDASFTVSLTGTSGVPVTFTVATVGITATAGLDFEAVLESRSIPAGWNSIEVVVPILDDAEVEPTESYQIEIYDITNATVGDAVALGRIVDNEVAR